MCINMCVYIYIYTIIYIYSIYIYIYIHLPSASPPPCPTGCLKFCTLPVLFSPQTGKKQDGMLAFFRCPCYPLRPLHCLKITEKSVKQLSQILILGVWGGSCWPSGGPLVPFGPKRASRAEKVGSRAPRGLRLGTTFGVHFRCIGVQD